MRQLQKLQQLTMNFQGCSQLSDPMGPQWHPRESHGRPIGAPWMRPDAPLVIEVPGHPRQQKNRTLLTGGVQTKTRPVLRNLWKSKRKGALVTKLLEIKRKHTPFLRNRWKWWNEKLGPCLETGGNQTKTLPLLWNRWKSNEPGEISWKYGPLLRNRWKSGKNRGPCYATGGNQLKNRALVTKLGKIRRKPGPCYETGGNPVKRRTLVTKPVEIQ